MSLCSAHNTIHNAPNAVQQASCFCLASERLGRNADYHKCYSAAFNGYPYTTLAV